MAEAAEDIDVEMDISEDNTEDNTSNSPQQWPDDWRQQIAGDDEKALNQLGRYATPADIWTKARALEQRISSGELQDQSPFPDKGTEDEQAAWRAERNLPDAPDKYEISREMEKEDREQLQGFLEFAHTKNMTPGQVNDMIDFFYQKLDQDTELMTEGDKAAQQAADDALRAEWGNEYRGYMNRIDSLVDMIGGDAKESFLNARLEDGTQLKSSPEIMKFLLNSSLQMYPHTTPPPPGGDTMSSIQDELDQIKDVMKTDRKKYNADEKMQARYRELLAAQERMGPK